MEKNRRQPAFSDLACLPGGNVLLPRGGSGWKKTSVRGLAAALLCVVTMAVSGCGKQAQLYTAQLAAQTETDAGVEEADAAYSTDWTESAAADSENAAGVSSAVTDQSGTSAGLSAAGNSGESETETVIGYVYVCGAVREPGVYPISGDMRICDAIALAGGFSTEADEEWLNQAQTVCDGQKLYVYTEEETALMKESGMAPEGMDGSAGSGGTALADGENASADESVPAASGSDTADGKVNLNTATREELMTLPGIGESKADAILSYRSEHGAFASIDEIQNISGIKSGVFSKIKDLITV